MDRQDYRDKFHAERVARLREAVQQAQMGKFDRCFVQFDFELRCAGLTLGDLEITEADVEAFAHSWWVQSAREDVMKAQADTNSYAKARMAKYIIEEYGVTHAEASTTPEEIDRLCNEEGLRLTTEALEKCRNGVFEQSGNSAEQWLNGLQYEMENYQLSPEEIGSSQAELDSFMRPDALALIIHLMKEVKEDLVSTDNYFKNYYHWEGEAWSIFHLMEQYSFKKEEIADEMSQEGADLEMIAFLAGEEFVKSWARFVCYSDGRLKNLGVITTVIDNWQLGLESEELAILTKAEQILLKWAETRDIEGESWL